MSPPTRGILVVLASVVAVFAMFLLGFYVGRSTGPHLVPPGPIPIELGAPGRYVALGDSYSAGEGLPPYVDGTQDVEDGGDRCHQSSEYAYGRLLTFAQETTGLFRPCSGAVVAEVYDEIQEHSGVPDQQGHQVEPGVLGDDVRLVTISVGGNDLDFAKALNFCLSESHCQDQAYKGAETLSAWIDERLERLGGELASLYERLRADAPNARILVLGYPALFPENAPAWYDPQYAECTTLFSLWTDSEREAIRAWGLDLNEAIQAAAHDAGVEYVDTLPHFAGHEPCGSSGEWVRFVGLTSGAVRDGSFHPRREGQGAMARIISCYLDVHPSPAVEGGTEQEDSRIAACVADTYPSYST